MLSQARPASLLSSKLSQLISDAAVSGVDSVPQTVNAVSDITVDTINAVPTTFNTFANPANTVRVISQTPGQVVNLGNSAFNTVGQVPFTAFRVTGNALRAGANVFTRTPAVVSNFADTAVSSGKIVAPSDCLAVSVVSRYWTGQDGAPEHRVRPQHRLQCRHLGTEDRGQ